MEVFLDTFYNTKLKDVSFVFVDTETTGLSYDSYIVEIGLVKCRGVRLVDTASYLVKPPISIPRSAVRIHGITNDDVKGAPYFDEIVDDVLYFVGDSIIVAHNASFDVNVWACNLIRAGKPLPDNYVIDTIDLVKTVFPSLGRYSLENLAKLWDSPYREFHRALVDAKNAAFIFFSVLKKGGFTFEETLEDFVSYFGPLKRFHLWCAKMLGENRKERKVCLES